MIFTIALRELKGLFLSPLAWVVLLVVEGTMAIFFSFFVQESLDRQASQTAQGVTESIVPVLFWLAGFVLMFVIPLLTMRLIAEERRYRTLPLLFSAPISMTEIVLGKYLGVTLFLLLIVTLVSLMPLSLFAGSQIDLGLIASAVLGLALTVTTFAAIGLFTSTLTQNPIVAAIGSIGISLFIWFVGLGGEGDTRESLSSYLSLQNHYGTFLAGNFDTTSAAYYVLAIAFFIILGIRRLDAERLGG